jgi:hypothetical protein
MPEGYSWRAQSISESAAQGQLNGWIARLSFLLFGSAALVLSVASRPHWPRITFIAMLVFASCMAGAAAFSHSPWLAGASDDKFEDLLHSVCANVMGLAFCVAVFARLFHRPGTALIGRSLDVVALLAAVLLPLALASSSSLGGVAQRAMFFIAYIWFAHEASVCLTPKPSANAA